MKKSMKLFGIFTSAAIAFTFLANINLNKISEVKTSAANTEVATEVSAIKSIKGYNGTDYFFGIKLKENDYKFSYNGGNDFPLHTQTVDYRTLSNFYDGRITFNGTAVTYTKDIQTYLVYYGNAGTIAFRYTDVMKNVKEGDKVFIPKGTSFPSYGIIAGTSTNVYVTQEDVEFSYKDGNFRKVIETTSEATEISSLKIVSGYDSSTRFFIINLSNNDYDKVTENKGNDYNLDAAPQFYGDACNFGYTIELNGKALNFETKRSFLNYFANYGGIGIEFTNEAKALKNFDEIKIKASTSFPSYQFCKATTNLIYVTSEEKIFTYFNNEFHCCNETLSAYDYDETNHWKVCLTCGKEFDKHTHNIVSGEMPATCTLPGYENCLYCDECNYVQQEGTIIEPLDHDFESSTYEFNDEGHWRHCHRNCGEVEEVSPHIYGADKKTCTVCGYVKDVVFITVTNGYVNGSETGEVKKGSITYIIPNPPEDGKMFEGWYQNGTKVSELATYSFEATKDDSFEARYKVDPDWGKQEEKKKSGCGSSIIGASSIIFTTSLFGIFLTIKKKRL